ncbi:helix-turn-helix domain-containing protein [Kibdelosporangium lantanae]|uniref:Helix-turn-helix domain-containing protein n=1 Tax=Kibdelosporangium lantanae TaxID=1497396 RepID=A0ABW3M4L7_9PSEU
MVSVALSENLARFRKARNLSQEQLAEAASVGVDTVGRIERAERRTTRPSTVAKLANALGVSTETLLGVLPARGAQNDEAVADLRQAVTAIEDIPGLSDFTDDREVLPVSTLGTVAHRAWRSYVDGRHAELLHALPTLIIDARRLVRNSENEGRGAGYRVLSTAYRLAAGISGRLELDDLAWTAAERALQAARNSDTQEIETAISLRYLVWSLIRQGRLEEAERVAIHAAEMIEPRGLNRDPHRAGIFGNLLFNAATAAVRQQSGERAADLLAVAQSAAVRSGRDIATEAAIFGPRVTALQTVEQALRLGDPEKALILAEDTPDARGEVPAFWEAGHRLHIAHAAAETRRDREALAYLAEARDIAPTWVQHQPLGRVTMGILVDRASRRQGEVFASLATHYGLVQ